MSAALDRLFVGVANPLGEGAGRLHVPEGGDGSELVDAVVAILACGFLVASRHP